MSSWVVQALNVSRTRSRKQGWDGLGMLSGRKRTIEWRNAEGWMWPEWWAEVLRGKRGGESGEGHEGYGYKGGNGPGLLCLEENSWSSWSWNSWRNITGVQPVPCLLLRLTGRWTHMTMMKSSGYDWSTVAFQSPHIASQCLDVCPWMTIKTFKLPSIVIVCCVARAVWCKIGLIWNRQQVYCEETIN